MSYLVEYGRGKRYSIATVGSVTLGGDGLVFAGGRYGGRLDNAYKAWAGVLERAGIEDFQ